MRFPQMFEGMKAVCRARGSPFTILNRWIFKARSALGKFQGRRDLLVRFNHLLQDEFRLDIQTLRFHFFRKAQNLRRVDAISSGMRRSCLFPARERSFPDP